MTDELIKEILLKNKIFPASIMHDNKKRVKLTFEYDERLTKIIKQTSGSKWSTSLCCWHIPSQRVLLLDIIKKLETLSLNDFNIPVWLDDYMRVLTIKAYSPSTLKNYRGMVLLFAYYFKNRDLKLLEKSDIEKWLEYLAGIKNYSSSTLNSAVNAVKFLYEQVWLNDRIFYRLPRAKKDVKLPKVLHESEIEKIFRLISNPKHKVMLYLAYGGGLRVSEIVNLKIADIRSARMEILIQNSKGKKDRVVMLSEKVLLMLREYYKICKPKVWLFEGQWAERYSTRSVQMIFNRAKRKAGVRLKGGPHLLRHSFATHLIESGIDISIIQELLGHTSVETTRGYIQVSNKQLKKIISPMDKLDL